MPFSTGRYRISSLWAEFSDPVEERAFLAHMQPMWARHLRVALFVWAGLLMAFGLLDLQALGWSREFFILLACRGAQSALLVGFALVLPRRPQLASSGYTVTALEIIGFFLFMPIYFLRPDIATLTIVVLGVTLLTMMLFIPNRLKLNLVSATVAVTLALTCIALNGRGPAVVIGAGIFLSLPVLTGFFGTQQLARVQRQQFAMFNEARAANLELQKEVERRKVLEEELQRQATTDPLTGLFNRRQYEMLFRRERERCRRQGTSICVAMADLDHFKALNDELGHDAGDIALRHVAGLFKAQLREGDVVGRFGGEEFIILLPDTDVGEAERVIERLRGELEANPVMIEGQPRTLTATFSVSAVRDGERNIVDTLRRVDAGLYHGKHTGRNQVVAV